MNLDNKAKIVNSLMSMNIFLSKEVISYIPDDIDFDNFFQISF